MNPLDNALTGSSPQKKGIRQVETRVPRKSWLKTISTHKLCSIRSADIDSDKVFFWSSRTVGLPRTSDPNSGLISPTLFEGVVQSSSEQERVALVSGRRVVDVVILRADREAEVLVGREAQPGDELRRECRRMIERWLHQGAFVEDHPMHQLSHVDLPYIDAY